MNRSRFFFAIIAMMMFGSARAQTNLTAPVIFEIGGMPQISAANEGWFTITINDQYSGGVPGNVNSGIRLTTNVGSGVLDYPWSILGIVNSSSQTAQPVGVYGQANNTGPGEVWGMVAEAHSTQVAGTAVGIEVDSGCTAGGNCVGVDVVQPPGQAMTGGAYRGPCGVKLMVDSSDPTSYLMFTCGTPPHFEIVLGGKLAKSF